MILIIDILTVLIRFLPIFFALFKESLTKEGDCSICLDTFNNDKKTIRTKECGHVFHLDCLNTWVKKNPSCPCCRSELKVITV